MKRVLLLLLLALIALVTLSTTVLADGPLTANSNSGSRIFTGSSDWVKARNGVNSSVGASYLQVETSWYNGGYDIYEVYLEFEVPGSVSSATLTIMPTGVIYNQDNVRLVVVDANSMKVLGGTDFSNLGTNLDTVIELDGPMTGDLLLLTGSEYENIAPLGWNWITLDTNSNRPILNYVLGADKGASSGFPYLVVVCGVVVVVLLAVLWKVSR